MNISHLQESRNTVFIKIACYRSFKRKWESKCWNYFFFAIYGWHISVVIVKELRKKKIVGKPACVKRVDKIERNRKKWGCKKHSNIKHDCYVSGPFSWRSIIFRRTFPCQEICKNVPSLSCCLRMYLSFPMCGFLGSYNVHSPEVFFVILNWHFPIWCLSHFLITVVKLFHKVREIENISHAHGWVHADELLWKTKDEWGWAKTTFTQIAVTERSAIKKEI